MVQQIILFSYHQRMREILTEDKPKHWTRSFLFFCICSVVCSTLRPVTANPVPSDTSTMKVSELPFSEKLSNPCALVDASRLQRGTLTQESRENTRRNVINQMKAKASLLKDNAETILRTNVLKDCSSLELPSVAVIPSADDISDNIPLEVLRLFYTSLLNHTAHVYFISEQLQRHAQDDTCNSADLSTNAKSLAADMRELMCVLRLSTLTLQQDSDENDSFEDSTDQILNEQLTDQPLCSRRSVRDCQTVGSTVTLLRELSNYLQTTVLFDDVEFTS